MAAIPKHINIFARDSDIHTPTNGIRIFVLHCLYVIRTQVFTIPADAHALHNSLAHSSQMPSGRVFFAAVNAGRYFSQ